MRNCRILLCVFFFAGVMAMPCAAHHLEPISTDFARPFAPGAGSLQFNYEYERRPGEGLHLIPEAEFELGFAPRMQFSIELPLIHQQTAGAPSRTGAGHAEFSVRYLLAGGDGRKFALSINPFVAPPTGRRSLAGDATEAGIGLNFDREFSHHINLRGNYGWSTTIGGSEEREREFFYRTALVFPVSFRWIPVIEFLGETDTATGHTEFVVQPEVIFYANAHWELKAGLPVRAAGQAPSVGVKAQVSWIFGKGSD